MAGKPTEIGAFEAKSRLSELLRETERGRTFLIRKRGKAVARLVPLEREVKKIPPSEILNAFRKIRKQIPGKMKVRELIEEGRRF